MVLDRMLIAGVTVLLLSACASLSETKPGAPFNDIDVATKTDLKPINLAPGDCGLFIWTADVARRFILFKSETNKTGRWLQGGEEIALTLSPTHNNKDTFTFETETGLTLDLALSRREPINGGVRYKGGTLSYVSDEGWERVEPVVGLETCQPS